MIAPVRVSPAAPRYVGSATLKGERWHLEVPPHVEMVLRRLFKKTARQVHGQITLAHTAETCFELRWISERWPLRFDPELDVERGARKYEERIATVQDILGGDYDPPSLEMALALRSYQARHGQICYELGREINGDALGLGKTAAAIGLIARPDCRPAVVVVPTHLQRQWLRELGKFLPQAHVHIAKKTQAYPLGDSLFGAPDVLIITYAKLHGWVGVLKSWAKTIIFDECHALRRVGSIRYDAADALAIACKWRMGLTATPTFNLGGEIYNIINVFAPGLLGTREEFASAWLDGGIDRIEKRKIKDARAFGSYLREIGLLVRHTRKDVGRELPPITHIPQTVSTNPKALEAIQGDAARLAELILSEAPDLPSEAFGAGGQLDVILRQATGIAKAPYVAGVVEMLAESGEPIILVGWHRAVYDIWKTHLEAAGITCAMYTGSESPAQKELSKKRFLSGDAQVLILSLRSGEGLDGLQEVCSVMVFGELDWTYSVLEQCIGRIDRDGQKNPILVYWLTALTGCDPLMEQVIGVKEGQMKDIRDPDRPAIETRNLDGDRMRDLARSYLEQMKGGAKNDDAEEDDAAA